MYYQDLTPYEYWRGESSALNVGWLDAAHPFPTGDVPAGFVERLRRLARTATNQAGGCHDCEFCGSGPKAVDAVSSAEIRVNGRDGRVYAAPTMICHYVEAHGYKPPQEFIEAVMQSVDLAAELTYSLTEEQERSRQQIRERLHALAEKLREELR